MGDPPRRRSQPLGVPVLIEKGQARDPYVSRALTPPRGRARSAPETWDDDLTPVTMIKAVRSELKDDIEGIRTDVAKIEGGLSSVDKSVASLTAQVETTNKIMTQAFVALQNELTAKRTFDESVVLSQMKITTHREMTQTDVMAADRAVSREIKHRIAVWALSAGGIATVLTALIASRC